MCWNESVSMNTFLFSMFVLSLIIYNNAYTKYKIKELDNFWMYVFMVSVVSMQLIEFFIWRNMKNMNLNRIFTMLGRFLLIIQPIFSLMILPNDSLRNKLLVAYLLISIPYSFHVFSKDIYSNVSKNGHLSWNSYNISPVVLICYLFFLVFSFAYKNMWLGILVGFLLIVVSYYNYNEGNTLGSMWCWMINSFAIYYAFYLLICLPFIEKKDIC